MPRLLQHILGPRVSEPERSRRPLAFMLPALVFSVARVLLLVSIFLPYWRMDLVAPQYPDGLVFVAYVHHLEGDVKEINGLNHYIGMRPLEQAGDLERDLSVWAIIAMVLLVEGAGLVHTKWAVAIALPAILFPVGFVADLYFWMRHFGQNLDPKAPLSASVKPFTPTLLGEGGIGQFRTWAEFGPGFWLAVATSLLVVIGFVFHYRAYRPLARRRAGEVNP